MEKWLLPKRFAFKFLLFAILIYLPAGYSYGSASCADKLASIKQLKPEAKIENILSRDVASDLFSKIEPEIQEIYKNETLSESAKARMSFDVYLRYRIALLPSGVVSRVNDLLENHTKLDLLSGKELSEVSYYKARSFYDADKDVIRITLPSGYEEGLLVYTLRIHEVEHAIQHYLVGINKYKPTHPKYFYVFRFNMEEGSMTAEALYLQSIPLEARLNLLGKLRSDRSLPKIFKKFFEGQLTSAVTSGEPMVYIEKEWGRGRYSHSYMLIRYAHVLSVSADLWFFDFVKQLKSSFN